MNQLSFIEALEPKRTEAAPLSKMELLAAGLKRDDMSATDRLGRLGTAKQKLESYGDVYQRDA